jgi:exo-1,4-beta-D-glucosaminidase
VFLREGWTLQSSCKISATGAQISSPGYATAGWHHATVPTTVLAALVADGTYPDPYFSSSLRSIPGGSYQAGSDFALLPMPANSPFRCSWWYRTEFTLPASQTQNYATLRFNGINNRANIWLNGKRIATTADVAGADRTYEFDVSSEIRASPPNALAVEVFAQTPRDFGITWIDWNPAPPDKDMGLWRDVYVARSGPIVIHYPQVVTHFPSAALDLAELTVEAQIRNLASQSVSGMLIGTIDGIEFRQKMSLAPKRSRTAAFTPDKFPQLRLHDPKLWWPAQMGEPALHDLRLRFVINGTVSDEQTVRVGLREITSSLDDRGNRLFRINGKNIFIRGAGWAPDMLLRESPDRMHAEFRYIRDLNLNTIRLEGKLESDEFYDMADQQGVLVMAGWSCCDKWQQWDKWTAHDLRIATASQRSQILRLRAHPSLLAWLNGSDDGPPPNVEQAFLAILKDADWPNPVLFSVADTPSTITGATGVKMTGPYDYVPPDFWLTDDGHNGGAAGFNTETSPGPAIPPKSSLAKMFPAGDLRLGSPAWIFHDALGTYSKLDHFNEMMVKVYGPPTGLDDYERKAQAMAYDSERAMFEAYSRNKYSATTGIVQWMLNNAWPSLFWHLYDYYLQPAGGYFGAKKALEPLHVQYSYDDRSVVVVNSTYANAASLKVIAAVYDTALQKVFSSQTNVTVAADNVARAVTIPQEALAGGSAVHFICLTLARPDGQTVSTNFYWLPSQPDVFDWSNASFRYTPVSSYGDLTALLRLKPVHLEVSLERQNGPEGPSVHVHLKNPSANLAFQIRVAIRPKAQDSEVLPVIWSDNYFELLPGESREIAAQYFPPAVLPDNAELLVTGWNISNLAVPISLPRQSRIPR